MELEPELEGLLHISEMADHKVEKPQDVVKPGDEVEVKILKVDTEARKIGLSLRRVQWAVEDHTTGDQGGHSERGLGIPIPGPRSTQAQAGPQARCGGRCGPKRA